MVFPIHLAKSEPPLFDPTDSPSAEAWFPATPAAELLVVSIEAVKDVCKLTEGLDPADPGRDRRGLTLLSPPVVSLMENALRLHRVIGSLDRRAWPISDRNNLIEHGRQLRRLVNGRLRQLRNRRAAHHDPRSLGGTSAAPVATLELLVPPFGSALVVLLLLLNDGTPFSWTRRPDVTLGKVFQIIHDQPVAFSFELDEENRPTRLLTGEITTDPRQLAKAEILRGVHAHNFLASHATPRLPALTVTETNTPHPNRS